MKEDIKTIIIDNAEMYEQMIREIKRTEVFRRRLAVLTTALAVRWYYKTKIRAMEEDRDY